MSLPKSLAFFISPSPGTLFFTLFLVHATIAQTGNRKIAEVLNLIGASYVDSVDTDALNDDAIAAILSTLDPHSTYIPAGDVNEMNESLQGSFEGVGIHFDIFRDTVFVVGTVSGGPSQLLGIRAGDMILAADGVELSGRNYSDEDVTSRLRGKKGSQVRLRIRRFGAETDVDYLITRDRIPINSIEASYLIDPLTGYIRMSRFAKTTHEEFLAALTKLRKSGMKDLMIDLRGNSGGYLYSAVEIADELLDLKGVIVSTRGKKHAEQIFNAGPGGHFTKGHLIIIIDEGSASASEILAGAIQDWDRGTIIGRRSFGKGLVMKPYSLSDGSVIRLTTSRYYTPSGRCIQKDYSASKEEYDGEISQRYSNGEVYSRDTNPRDEEKYVTSQGRTVFGGGGISPDIFVPADSVILGNCYQSILGNGNIVEFTLDYTNRNRESLGRLRNEADLFGKPELMRSILQAYGQFTDTAQTDCRQGNKVLDEALTIQLCAFISQHLWGEESYYRSILRGQDVMEQALRVMKDLQSGRDIISEKNN